jgi:2'-5' RNA ligase
MLSVEPSIAVVERLALLQEELARPLHHLDAEVLWTPAEHIRLNLRVLDELDTGVMQRLRVALHQWSRTMAPPRWRMRGVQWVGGGAAGLPRLLACSAESTDGDTSLASLQRSVDSIVQQVGAGRAERPWAPWVQLGRLRTEAGQPLPRLEGVLDAWSGQDWGQSRSPDMVLMRSEGRGGSVVWRVLDRFRMQPVTGA